MANRYSYVTLAFAALVVGAVLLISVTAVLAYAQEGYKELSGRYVNSEAGVEVTFPDGWTGGILETVYLEGVVVPGGFNGSAPAKDMVLMMHPKTLVVDNKTIGTGDGPFEPSGFILRLVDCDAPSFKSRTVSGVQGTEVQMECPGTESSLIMVAVETKDEWFVLQYRAQPAEFAADFTKFGATVDSLKVQGAIDSTLGTGTSIKTATLEYVMVGGEEIPVKFGISPSSCMCVLDVELNEESKTLSFLVNGTDESSVVLVGAVLEGPYVVTIDGQVNADFEETISYSGVNTISVPHGAGEHEITITGTQVVPEFPVAALGVVAAFIGIAAVIGRTRFSMIRAREK